MSTDRVDCSRAWYSEGATARAAQASPAIRSGHSRTGDVGRRASWQAGPAPGGAGAVGQHKVRRSSQSKRCKPGALSVEQHFGQSKVEGRGSGGCSAGCSRLASSSTRAHAGLAFTRLLSIPASESLDVPAGGGTVRAVLLPPAGRFPLLPAEPAQRTPHTHRTADKAIYAATYDVPGPSLLRLPFSLSPVAMANLVRLLRRIRLEGRAAAQ